jgi:fucose permease
LLLSYSLRTLKLLLSVSAMDSSLRVMDTYSLAGFIFVVAQAGGNLFPSITGLIATKAGVGVLQPIVLALIVVGGFFWWLVPKVPERSE